MTLQVESRSVSSEPDWRRLPGFRDVTEAEWNSALWQRARSVRTVKALKGVFGPLLPDSLAEEIERDRRETAVMRMLVPPQMLNTMDERDLGSDPVRRYMLPARSEREQVWPSHPRATRDSLLEAEMWAVEGLVHRYPGKALVELISTCPQYFGHCTRMDLVGGDTPQVVKYRFRAVRRDRQAAMLEYLRVTDSVSDVVVSGGDLANVPMPLLEEFVTEILRIPHVRDVRLASKSLVTLPQHFLDSAVLAGLERLVREAHTRDVALAVVLVGLVHPQLPEAGHVADDARRGEPGQEAHDRMLQLLGPPERDAPVLGVRDQIAHVQVVRRDPGLAERGRELEDRRRVRVDSLEQDALVAEVVEPEVAQRS